MQQQQPASAVDVDHVQITPLGSGQEVGRSCIILSYKGCKVMLDCGVHPAEKGLNSLPYFPDNCDDIDLVLITHFHLDHCAGLPYLCEQTNFRGRIFMTPATKAFFKICMNDYLSIGNSARDVATKEWVQSAYERIETVEYHQEIVHNGIQLQPFNAGHVLGAAMFMVDIAGAKILYTGDYSRTPDRHLLTAEIPPVSPDFLIVESTYGTNVLEPREDREAKFIRWVNEVVVRGGRCLIPVFALGRAQELLLILEEHWERNTNLQHIPIYYASSMATKSMKQYQTFVSGMNDWVKDKNDRNENPFDFKYIKSLKSAKALTDDGACVVLASPGMLQSGVSYDLFERWCGDSANGIIIAGYCTDGTVAKQVLTKSGSVTTSEKKTLRVRMGTIESVSFSAHSDFRQTKEFIDALQTTQHVVLVHGQEEPMRKLSDRLKEDFGPRGTHVYTPRNQERVSIPFATQRVAKVLGSLAKEEPKDGAFVNGVLLVSDQHKYTIVHPRDISTYTGLVTAAVHQAMVVPLPAHRRDETVFHLLKTYFAASEMFSDVTPSLTAAASPGVEDDATNAADTDAAHAAAQLRLSSRIHIAGSVHADVAHNEESSHTTITIKWVAGHVDDLVADISCIAILQDLQHSAVDDDTANAATGDAAVDAALPVERRSGDEVADAIFRHKCFHHFLAQFYNGVTTNLSDGLTDVFISPALTLRVTECVRITAITSGDAPMPEPEIVAESRRLGDVLKRVYLTLFPIPADSGWCECGKLHYDDSLKQQALP